MPSEWNQLAQQNPQPPQPEQPKPQPPQPEIPPSGPQEPQFPSPDPEPLPTPVPGPTDPGLPQPISYRPAQFARRSASARSEVFWCIARRCAIAKAQTETEVSRPWDFSSHLAVKLSATVAQPLLLCAVCSPGAIVHRSTARRSTVVGLLLNLWVPMRRLFAWDAVRVRVTESTAMRGFGKANS